MKAKYKIITLAALVFMANSALSSGVYAQNTVTVKAGVGKYYFSASGIVSPYATVVMTTQNTFMSSTVADAQGNFSLPEALVNEGFTSYCLEAVDIKRLGTSYTCFNTGPAESDFEDSDLFLAPTVGLSGRSLTPGSSILASGYSMPGSEIDVNISRDLIVQATADEQGFYKATIEEIPAGKYKIYPKAVYQKKTSITPTRTFEIESLSRLATLPRWLLLVPLVLIAVAAFILFFILWKRRKKKKQPKSPVVKSKNSRSFSWHA